MADILPFRNPKHPLTGAERLRVRRNLRDSCKVIAAKAVAQTWADAVLTEGIGKLGIYDVLPLYVAAMRRELRKIPVKMAMPRARTEAIQTEVPPP